MPEGVQFEEEGGEISLPTRHHVAAKSNIAASLGFGRNPAQANAVLILFAAVLMSGSFYLMVTSIPKPPLPLTTDTLRNNESVGPNYR